MNDHHIHTEKELLSRIAEDDREAFTLLYTRAYPNIFRYLLVVTRSRDEAEEILQDIFLKVWVKRSTLAGLQSFENYLFTMAKHRLFDLRKKKTPAADDAEIPDVPGGDHVFQELLLKEYLQLARQAIDQLPEKRREIFLMNAQSELTAREIAEKMGMSLPAVKKQLYEASHFIRDYLARHGALLLAAVIALMFP